MNRQSVYCYKDGRFLSLHRSNFSFSCLGLDDGPCENVENSTVLDTITISGLGSTTEGTGSYTTGAMSTGVKLPLSVKETPQTVTVVTRQKIEDKSYETLDQAVADTPGLIANQNFGDARYQYWSRGLIIDNMQYDGVANPVQYYARDSDGADDMDMYDRVEVLRGASGLVTGAGNPSGAINLMRKRPLDEKKTTITTRASSWGASKRFWTILLRSTLKELCGAA